MVSTSRARLQVGLERVAATAGEFARLPAVAKAALLRECMGRLERVASQWVALGNRAKGLSSDDAEEWLVGPVPTMRMLRLLGESLEAIARRGRPSLGRRAQMRSDGRLLVDCFPASAIDAVLFAGYSGRVLMEAGVDVAEARARQAVFYQCPVPEGGVSLVLGAGNASSLPALDVANKMFVDGHVCVLKINPVNAWVGPIVEDVFAPLCERGHLAVVHGGASEGAFLIDHELITDVHLTGSGATYDAIVWGPAGPERDRRKSERRPRLNKPITAELGNVSPVVIVPFDYGEDELRFQADNLVSMVVQNASFNCNAAKLLVTARGWPQRERFLELVARSFERVPPRVAYYPGAFERYDLLTKGRTELWTSESVGERQLPWTMIRSVDADNREDPVFHTEPFCAVLSETAVGGIDPVEFLAEVTDFLNERVWGTLNACIVVSPQLERDRGVAAALDRAVVELRYGTVGINHWPALAYGAGGLPWGAYPSDSLVDIQSGRGWVQNTYMLGGIDKSIIRGPLLARPTPIWFAGRRHGAELGNALVSFEAAPRWPKIPRLLATLL